MMREDLEHYQKVDAISYSKLSQLNTDPKNLIADEKKESKALDFGSLVDCMMFTPEDLNERFYFTKISKPYDKLGEWLDAYLNIEIPPDFTLNDVDKLILQARRIVGYQMNWKDDTALKKWNEEVTPYLEEVAHAGINRTIITESDQMTAVAMQNKLLTNEFTRDYFTTSHRDKEVYHQVPIYYSIEGEHCKSLLDGVLIDKKTGKMLIFDLKTTSDNTFNFESSFLKWNYFLQASLYHDGLRLAGLTHYKEVEPRVIFIVANNFQEPLIWECDAKHLVLGRLGGITRSGKKIKGYLQLIEDYKWHRENQLYDYPASVYQSNGVKQIDIL